MGTFTQADKRRGRRFGVVLGAAGVLLASGVLSACGSSSSSTPTTIVQHATSLVGKRYCEILLVTATGGLHATVYNTYPLNACPEAKWSAIDPSAIAKENGALAALPNGPRFWLMDGIVKSRSGTEHITSFGGIAMIEEATVAVSPADLKATRLAFDPHSVNRTAAFTFHKGRQVYELHDPSGQAWVMQTWSQQVDPTLSESALADLGPKLALPSGWTYTVRTLQAPLVIATETQAAHVLQDNLGNSYSLESAR